MAYFSSFAASLFFGASGRVSALGVSERGVQRKTGFPSAPVRTTTS